MTENTVIKKKSIAITGGIISDINDFKKLKKGKTTQIINGKNKYVMPGMAEMHSHLPAPEKVDTYLISNIAAGVTRLRAMNSETDVMEMKRLIDGKAIAPEIYYPLIITDESPISSRYDMAKIIVEGKENGYSFIKLFSIKNEETFDWLMQYARESDLIVCGHYPKMVKLDKVLASGFKSIEHLGGYAKIKDDVEFNSMLGLTKKFEVYNCPTLDWDAIAANLQFFDDYKTRLVFKNAPTHLVDQWNNELENYINTEGRDKILQDKESYLPIFQNKYKVLKRMNELGCLLLLGSDPGGLYQMHGFNLYEEMVHWSKAGINNYDILLAATVTPAKFFKEETQWGTIEVNKYADLIMLDKNPLDDITNMATVQLTIVQGKVYWKKELLKKI